MTRLMKRHLSTVIIVLALLTSCQEDGLVPFVELGAPVKEYITPAERNAVEIPVYANGKYTARFLEDVDWADISTKGGKRDGSLYVMCTRNEGFKRSLKLLLESTVDSRVDTVLIKQQGSLSETLYMANTSLILSGAGGAHREDISVNLPADELNVDVIYPAADEWVGGYEISDGKLLIQATANEDEIAPRTASMTISYLDGWGETMSLSLNLVQRNSKEGLGQEISISEYKQNYAVHETQIKDYIILEGIVVSNQESGNVAENEQTTTTSIDYTMSQKSIYLQTPDGADGVKIMTATVEDNTFRQFDKVKLLLHGTMSMVYEQPDRYVIEGLTSSMVLSHQSGSKSDVTVKEKTVSQLTDRDIYTYVTLKDVAFSVRKGSLVPINEGYAAGIKSNRFNTYPRLMHDAEGQSIYLLTNTVCKYRSDGNVLPYGTGNVSGVIVHERLQRFNWKNGADPLDIETDPELGRMGTYQIRHQSREDIYASLPGSVEEGRTALLTEYRFWNPDTKNGVQRPTYGTNGYLKHTYPIMDLKANEPEKSLKMTSRKTYTYLGPVGDKADGIFGINKGNTNGCGIILDPEKERWQSTIGVQEGLVGTNPDGTLEWCGPTATNPTAQKINFDGKNGVDLGCYTAFQSTHWWDFENDRPYAWMINFSTKDLSTTQLSMQLSMFNSNYNSPRNWKAEWATTDSMEAADDSKWSLIGEFTVPDLSKDADTKFFTTSGAKQISFPLPSETIGKANVYIRLVPADLVCSTGVDYADALMTSSTTPYNILEYFAVRYTK